jgi:hypothetical protein
MFEGHRIHVGLLKTWRRPSGRQALSRYSDLESPGCSQNLLPLTRKDKSPMVTGLWPVINAMLRLRAAAPRPCYGSLLSDCTNLLNLHRVG